MTPIVPRSAWGAPPFTPTRIGPVSQVFIHHSVTNPDAPLVPTMQGLEAHARALGHKAIDYSFCHFQDGSRAEGRGWFAQGGHTLNNNSTSYGLCAIGNFVHDEITAALIDALATTIREGVALGAILPGAAIRPHSDVFATACPGELRVVIPEIARRVGNPTPTSPEEEPPDMYLRRIASDTHPYDTAGGAHLDEFPGAHVLIDGAGPDGMHVVYSKKELDNIRIMGVKDHPLVLNRASFYEKYGVKLDDIDRRRKF